MNSIASNYIVIPSPLGQIGLSLNQNKLTHLDVFTESTSITYHHNANIKEIIDQLSQYFNNPKHIFKINYELRGTAFQKKVWQTISKIPSGKTRTYGEIAKQLQTGPRAIGQACRTNPLPLIIPCHRVVAANNIGGYSGMKQGKWLDIKTWLLNHEQASF